MNSASVPSNSNVTRELERVAAALEKKGLKNDERMALLRRQAALGDLRDAIADRARRTGRTA